MRESLGRWIKMENEKLKMENNKKYIDYGIIAGKNGKNFWKKWWDSFEKIDLKRLQANQKREF